MSYAAGPAVAALAPRPFRVVRARRDTYDTVTLTLEPVDGVPLAFEAGQFTMLTAYGAGEVPISISGAPGEALLEHTIRDVGGVTRVLARTTPGDVLGVRGPLGVGWQAEDVGGGDLVVVAGGIGLAPVRPAVLQALAARVPCARIVVLVGARTPADLLYVDELETWRRSGVDVDVTVDRADASWGGRVGLVTVLLEAARFDPSRALALVCGPEVMMRHVARALVARGVPAHRVRLSMERNMKCGVGLCGHCQLREFLLCVDGPVLEYDRLASLLAVPEL